LEQEPGMTTISVLYPREDGADFDYDYYMETHLPLAAARWGDAGLTDARAYRGVPGPDGAEPPYLLLALLTFTSAKAFAAALGGPHTAEIMADVANFTGIQPVIQVNEAL
jgi:uncharacterized protein (TIGR02118 family)